MFLLPEPSDLEEVVCVEQIRCRSEEDGDDDREDDGHIEGFRQEWEYEDHCRECIHEKPIVQPAVILYEHADRVSGHRSDSAVDEEDARIRFCLPESLHAEFDRLLGDESGDSPEEADADEDHPIGGEQGLRILVVMVHEVFEHLGESSVRIFRDELIFVPIVLHEEGKHEREEYRKIDDDDTAFAHCFEDSRSRYGSDEQGNNECDSCRSVHEDIVLPGLLDFHINERILRDRPEAVEDTDEGDDP